MEDECVIVIFSWMALYELSASQERVNSRGGPMGCRKQQPSEWRIDHVPFAESQDEPRTEQKEDSVGITFCAL